MHTYVSVTHTSLAAVSILSF